MSATVYFDDFAFEQPGTDFKDIEAMSLHSSSGNALLMSGSIGMLGDSSTGLGETLEAELNKMVLDSEAESEGIGFAMVQRDFVALREGQMSVKTGDVIDCVKEIDQNWTLCVSASRDRRGNVPRSCLTML